MQINYDTSVYLDLNGELQTGERNPLYIPEITEHMFQFLQLSELKKCRLVCRKWNQLAEKFVQQLAVVNILEPKRVEEFNHAFPNPQQSRKFTSFRFGTRRYGFEWPVYQFVPFCEKWHQNLSELTLFSAYFWLEQDETFDLSPFLPSTLTKLRIQSKSMTSLVIISIDKICNLQIFQMEGCILNITPETILNNVELELVNVTFRRDGQENIEEFLINPLLNFDVLKKASFSGENIQLDLQGSHSLDKLSLLKGIKVLNWKTSNWEIKKISFCVNDQLDEFEEVDEDLTQTQIKYKELEMNLMNLNVSLLPEGIEKLQVCLYHDGEVPPRIYGQHNFPNLKELHVETKNDFSRVVEFFKTCPKLSVLTVTSFDPCYDSSGKSDLKTSVLPPSVTTLRVISGVRIIVDRSLQLESLIFHSPPFPFPSRGGKYNVIVELAKELNVKNLYWFGGDQERRYHNVFENEKVNTVKSLIDLNLDKIVVGEFSQVNNSIIKFEKSCLFPLVDKQGKYYLFQRGKKGKAISCRDAKKLSEP